MVLGNLTTTFEGKLLESGGMIYLNAKASNHRLEISPGKSILIAIKSDSTLPNMSIFEGEQDTIGMKWRNPVPIQGNFGSDSSSTTMESFEKTTNVTYSVDGFENDKTNFPEIVNREVSRIAWEGGGLKITKDSVFKIDQYTVRFYKNRKLQKWREVFTYQKGENSFIEDRRTHYIFSIKKLGWANIDRLLQDPRTQEVDFITIIENQEDFKGIYISMITPKMYLCGYQRKDNSYSFAHNDNEKMQLPIGETVTILATAYKNDKPYFAMQKVIITSKQNILLNLRETTMENLKMELMAKI